MGPLVSIIIPTYNRAHLIGETLDSILNQTYQNWECIVVDDQSGDHTPELIEFYIQKDQRIKYHWAEGQKKGANRCRNIGFKIAQGELIKWFDSDDIMLPRHLEKSINLIMEEGLDFAVTDSENFSEKGIIGKAFGFNRINGSITAKNYALNRIGWITDDFTGTREIVETVKFNEEISDGEEFNFFVQLLHQPFKAEFLNEVLTHRRIHSDSITEKNKQENIQFLSVIATLKYQTAKDLRPYKNDELIRWFLSGYMQYAFSLAQKKTKIPYKFQAFQLIQQYFSISKALAFLVALENGRIWNKGYRILKYARS